MQIHSHPPASLRFFAHISVFESSCGLLCVWLRVFKRVQTVSSRYLYNVSIINLVIAMLFNLKLGMGILGKAWRFRVAAPEKGRGEASCLETLTGEPGHLLSPGSTCWILLEGPGINTSIIYIYIYMHGFE